VFFRALKEVETDVTALGRSFIELLPRKEDWSLKYLDGVRLVF